jgi:hypothetical protein
MKSFFSKTLMFFTLAAAALASGCSPAYAQVMPYNVTLQQRNAADTGYVTRPLTTPANGANGLFYYNGTSQLPGYVVLGDGLTINSGVLSATSSSSAAQADWNATSGPSTILNKPTISTVGMTGQYGDLFGAPALAAVATSGQYSDIAGRPTLATVATTGNYADLSNKPAIPAAYTFNFGDPSARTLALSTAYQANDPSRAAIETISTSCTAALSLTAGGTCTLQVRTSSTTGLSCSTGTVYATLTNTNTGTLTIGLGLNQRVGSAATINLRAGSYFILCPTSGTFAVDSVVDQSAG